MRQSSFQQACAAGAEFIAKGGLREAPDVSQVDEKAWALLADINRHGMRTIDSQSGERSTYAGHVLRERAYVNGFMLRDQAYTFVDAINSTTPFVAFQVMRVQREPRRVPRIAVSVDGDMPFTRTPQVLAASSWDQLKKEADLAAVRPAQLALVAVFDPTYCRKAYGERGLFRSVAAILSRLQHSSTVSQVQ